MMQKVVKCGIAGGIVLFLWGMIAWTVLPWHKMHMMKFKDEAKVARVINENAAQSGIYVLPNTMNLPKDSQAMMEARDDMRMGPFVFASVSLEGKNPDFLAPMVKGLILKIIAACLVTWLLLNTKLNYNRRVGFVTMVGVVIGLMATLPQVFWVGFPLGYSIACMFEIIFGWFFAGLVIGKLVK
jgi:hypothetical protein